MRWSSSPVRLGPTQPQVKVATHLIAGLHNWRYRVLLFILAVLLTAASFLHRI